MKLNIPLENKDDVKVQLIVPFNYPDTQCTLQVQNTNMSPQTKRYIYLKNKGGHVVNGILFF
jgi:hypothetical protein